MIAMKVWRPRNMISSECTEETATDEGSHDVAPRGRARCFCASAGGQQRGATATALAGDYRLTGACAA